MHRKFSLERYRNLKIDKILFEAEDESPALFTTNSYQSLYKLVSLYPPCHPMKGSCERLARRSDHQHPATSKPGQRGANLQSDTKLAPFALPRTELFYFIHQTWRPTRPRQQKAERVNRQNKHSPPPQQAESNSQRQLIPPHSYRPIPSKSAPNSYKLKQKFPFPPRRFSTQ